MADTSPVSLQPARSRLIRWACKPRVDISCHAHHLPSWSELFTHLLTNICDFRCNCFAFVESLLEPLLHAFERGNLVLLFKMGISDRIPNNIHMVLSDDVMDIMHWVYHWINMVEMPSVMVAEPPVLWKALI